jgi:CheY-like chemotaxis protein
MIDDRRMGYALGATDYLTKPVDRDRLATVLQKYRCSKPPCPVLLVEDDSEIRTLIRRMLEKEGWNVHEASNGREGLRSLSGRRPRLVLLDLMMPEMDGFEFVLEMRKVESWRSIPVVVLTAKELTPADRDRLNGDVERILQKGAYDREELLREVRDLVSAGASGLRAESERS